MLVKLTQEYRRSGPRGGYLRLVAGTIIDLEGEELRSMVESGAAVPVVNERELEKEYR